MLKNVRRVGGLVVVGVLLFVALYLGETFLSVGELEPIESGFLGSCETVSGLTGPEDLTIHPETGVAYISAYDRSQEALGLPVRGNIYAYRPGSGGKTVDLTRAFEGDLRPHGISLWINPEREIRARSGRRARRPEPKDRLFAINHAGGTHSVEIFEIEKDRLVHVETVRDPLFLSPSDVAAVGPRSFYLANDTGTRPEQWAWYLENLWRFPFSNVIYHDGDAAREVADGVAKASGINLSPDGERVYVAAMMGRRIHLYERDVETGDLSVQGSIRVRTNPDNVEVDEDGSLWVGAHPRLVTLVRHVLFGWDADPQKLGGVSVWDPASLAPSQVLRIIPDEGLYELTQIYVDQGTQISASSVAARRGQRLLIGSLTASHILDCSFDPFPRQRPGLRRAADSKS